MPSRETTRLKTNTPLSRLIALMLAASAVQGEESSIMDGATRYKPIIQDPAIETHDYIFSMTVHDSGFDFEDWNCYGKEFVLDFGSQVGVHTVFLLSDNWDTYTYEYIYGS